MRCISKSEHLPISEAKYAYNGESATAAGEETPPAALRHLKEVSKSNLNVARKNQAVTTTDYGFIDMPPLPSSSSSQEASRGERDAKGGNGLGDKSRITADEDMIAGEICLSDLIGS